MPAKKIHLISEHDKGGIYYMVTEGFVLTSSKPILRRLFGPVPFDNKHLSQLQNLYEEAVSYATDLAKQQNRKLSTMNVGPPGELLEEVARYNECQKSARKQIQL